MLEVVARLILGGVLAGASLAKLASPASSRAAMATFGIDGRRAQAIAWALLIACELGLAAGVIAGSATAAYLAAALMATFAATMVGAILRGRAGAPCACFGARSTVGWLAVARNAALAAAFAALPALPADTCPPTSGSASGSPWRSSPAPGSRSPCSRSRARSDCCGCGWVPGARSRSPRRARGCSPTRALIGRFSPEPEASLALAVFVSAGCHVCHSLEPSIRALANDPRVAVATFDEVADAAVWGELGIPGSPFAIALDLEGLVLAKGTFNNLAQLESVLAAAERRRAERELAGAVGV